MIKNFKHMCLTSFAFILTTVASSVVSTNSMWILYEPEIPENLK
ncbi:MAG: cyclic lactone autoinducer peptide [Firmicutes bacterium]|nr:cyclic lactone autoinducer peptide [Bacillota bacterium]